jgi:hypothetical protein
MNTQQLRFINNQYQIVNKSNDKHPRNVENLGNLQKHKNKNNNNYDNNDDDEDDDEDDDDDDEEDEDYEEEIVPIKKNSYMELSHFITISSFDRDWEIDTPSKSQYDFQVKFAPSGNRIINRPLYFNNPTIPATPSQASQGLLGDANLTGWFSSSGTFYQAYNENQNPGPVVDYEKIVEIGQRGLALDNTYKNIVSIELTRALFPSLQRQIDYYPDLRENVVDESYYLMEIDELNGEVINGTSKDLKRAFAVLTPVIKIYDITHPSSKNIEYRTTNPGGKKYITPLSSLTNLTIRIKKPSGDILKNLNDVIDVKYIYQDIINPSEPRSDILVVETMQYFSELEYKPSDTIIFRNYTYHNTNTNSKSNFFNDFINRTKGHKILATASSDPSKFLKNRIYISRPAYLDIQTGGITEEAWYSDFKQTFENTPPTSNDTGRFINIDLQNIYFFKITTKEQSIQIESERV